MSSTTWASWKTTPRIAPAVKCIATYPITNCHQVTSSTSSGMTIDQV